MIRIRGKGETSIYQCTAQVAAKPGTQNCIWVSHVSAGVPGTLAGSWI